jgi:hypothetical protein
MKPIERKKAAGAMRELLEGALERWPEIESDEPINGADCVDWLADFLRETRSTLAAIKRGEKCN